MKLWHSTPDTKRTLLRDGGAWWLYLEIGTWPIEPDQTVWVEFNTRRADGTNLATCAHAEWGYNAGPNSYWHAKIGPFATGDRVEYFVVGKSPQAEATINSFELLIGPKLFLAILWHQHQPLYKDCLCPEAKGSFIFPWVRLHALRDYYSMAALVALHPGIRLTINLSPSLLQQVDAYGERGHTDRALELTLKPTPELTAEDREYILTHFFDADWHNEIYPHPRYKELFDKRGRQKPLTDADLTDLRMWFNLAWFAPEFQNGKVKLPDGSVASVARFIEKGAGFTESEITEMVAEQYKIMRNIVAIHRQLQDAGQIEVSTTPFYHPILPLLHDTDNAILDRDGSSLPARFSFPEDVDAQVANAVALYTKLFGRAPYGMWPAEGAVGESVIPHFQKHGIRWIATDQGVLELSGEWGYEADKPDVYCRPWRAGDDESIAVFFRDTDLSNAIGFRYGQRDPQEAAAEFVNELKRRFMPTGEQDRIVSIILDGENAWGSYRQAGRPFFDALYGLLDADAAIGTVTFSEYLDGNAARGVRPHPIAGQERVYRLAHASWIDETGSRSGNDLGTWIGEPQENAAWDLLRQTREMFRAKSITVQSHPQAFEALYAAEGSDWFWWYGDDQDCDQEDIFDDLFRHHLRCAYKLAGFKPPAELEEHLVPHVVTWSFHNQKKTTQPGDRLRFKSGCPGVLSWGVNDWQEVEEIELTPVGGVMAGQNVYSVTLRPFGDAVYNVQLQFKCRCAPVCHCAPDDLCCNQRQYQLRVARPKRRRGGR
ncbi:MAG: hypothetical protein PCFJNLEI_01204 [Verrucomicrobiae bacterium]|nr:hypothetical protein [Verrucomicrobiae bacterium]